MMIVPKKCLTRIFFSLFYAYKYLQLEIDSGSELSEEFFQDELHPKTMLHRPQFAKPEGPKNRGAKRLTRPQVLPTSDA